MRRHGRAGNILPRATAGVSLRGMTVNSTLVLIDGHRATNYPLVDDGQRPFVDLNTIPLDVVDRGFPFNTNDLIPIGGNNLNPQPSVFPYGTIYGSATPGTVTGTLPNGQPDLTTGVPNPATVSQPLRAVCRRFAGDRCRRLRVLRSDDPCLEAAWKKPFPKRFPDQRCLSLSPLAGSKSAFCDWFAAPDQKMCHWFLLLRQ